MQTFNTIFEEIKVAGTELSAKVKSLIDEGNISRIVIKNEAGRTLLDIPIAIAAVGAVIAPELAALGTLAALAAKFTIVVEKSGPPAPPPVQV